MYAQFTARPQVSCFAERFILALRCLVLRERCGERAIDVGDEFVERAIAVAQMIGDYLAVSPDHEQMRYPGHGIETGNMVVAVCHDVDLPFSRRSPDRGECLRPVIVAHGKYDEFVFADRPLSILQNR